MRPTADRRAVVAAYLAGGTSAAVGEQFGVSSRTVIAWVRAAGHSPRPRGGGHGQRWPTIVQCPSCGEERESTGPRTGVAGFIRAGERWIGPCRSCTRLELPAVQRLRDAAWMASEYEATSLTAIAKEVGVSPSTVAKWMRYHGVQLRSRSEVLHRRWATASQQRRFVANRQMVTGGEMGSKRRNDNIGEF